jgi:hypothetical protein
MDNEAVTKAEFYNEINKLVTKEDFQAELKKLATKEDLKKFATKEDLKKFATKEDLKKFATKEDLKKFATKEDLKKFATKKDLESFAIKKDLQQTKEYLETLIKRNETEIKKLDGKFDRLSSLVLQNTAKLDLMETKEDANEKFNQTMNRLDYIVGVLDNMRTEKAALDHGLTRVEKKVDQEKDRNDKQDEKLLEHEGRILKIEAQVAV